MKNFNLRQLEAFRAVMLGKTITRAAELLFISQPAVTRLINDLESKIGFALFERHKKRLYPTPEAHAFYEEIERTFSGLEKLNIAAREIRDFRSGSLAIAALPALGATKWTAFTRVTIPLIMPGIFGGWILAFITSFDELTMTVFIASPSTTTLPVRMYQHITETIDRLIASISAVIIFITMAMMIVLDRIFGLDKLLVGK